MNPILSAALGSILRWGLAIAAGFLVEHGIWTNTEAAGYVAAASLAVLSIGLSLWNKHKGRIRLLTALAMPGGVTEAEVDAHIVSGGPTPSVKTPTDMPPRIGGWQ